MSMAFSAASVHDGLLQRIDRLYRGAKLGDSRFPGPSSCSWSLRSLAKDLGVMLQPCRAEVVVAVVGDASSGKTSFVNALAEELTLLSEVSAPSNLPAQWQIFDENDGTWPNLLQQAAEQFPDWTQRAVAVVKSYQRVAAYKLRGIEVVEVSAALAPQDLEPVTWIASHADIVVCMLDSQAKQPSEQLLDLLKTVASVSEPPELQFVFSRADLLRRESDRIQHIAKLGRFLQESLGRRFEILPIATGDLAVLLDVLDANSDTPCKWDAGRCRALRSFQDPLLQVTARQRNNCFAWRCVQQGSAGEASEGSARAPG